MKRNLSHSSTENAYAKLQKKIKERGDLPYCSATKQLEYLDEMGRFPLGAFLIERGGLNGYWTHYVVCESKEIYTESPVANFLLHEAPITQAMRERYSIFQRITQNHLREGITFASIPCGLMADLLDLDFSKISRFKLVGIDYDSESLQGALGLAENRNLSSHIELMQKDAWALGITNQFDLVTSTGLNIYEPNKQKVIDLYHQFFLSLKAGGVLVTSFLTPPPTTTHPGEWRHEKINKEAALLQKILLGDILATKWQTFCPENEMKEMIQAAGFHQIEVHYDEAHIFPTLTAVKS